MNEPLFLESEIKFEKTAMEAKLSDSADTWPQEVLAEVHKQHPYLGKFDVSPVMQEVDGERGFGVGYLVVRNRTSMPDTSAGRALSNLEGVRTCKVPIIIADSSMKNIDVFIDPKGNPKPLNETRVREAMFRPNMYDAEGKPPAAAFLGDELSPPGRGRPGMWPSEVSKPKTSAAKPQFIMDAIGPTISSSDIERITNAMNENQKLASALLHNEATFPFIQKLAAVKPVTTEDVARAVADSVLPEVMMMTKTAEGYHLRTANSQMYHPEVLTADRMNMVKIASGEMVDAVDEHGVAVVHKDPVVRAELEDDRVEKVKQFGEYRVKDTMDKEHMGWVFPSVLNFDGTALPMSVFTNGSVSAIQEDIVGSFVGKGTNIIRGKPEGYGFFYTVTNDGSALAFVPCEIKAAAADDVGPYFLAESILGDSVKLRPVPGLKEIAKVTDSEYGIPGDALWAPMGEQVLKMVDDAELFVKTSALKRVMSTVEIVSDGNLWSFRGEPLCKLAHGDRESQNVEDALFLTCSLGVEPKLAMKHLVKAAQKGRTEIQGCKQILRPHQKLAEARAAAEKLAEPLPKKYLLLKEAA